MRAPRHHHTFKTVFVYTAPTSWGCSKFMPLATLRSRPGYLADDCLLLQVRVEVLRSSHLPSRKRALWCCVVRARRMCKLQHRT